MLRDKQDGQRSAPRIAAHAGSVRRASRARRRAHRRTRKPMRLTRTTPRDRQRMPHTLHRHHSGVAATDDVDVRRKGNESNATTAPSSSSNSSHCTAINNACTTR